MEPHYEGPCYSNVDLIKKALVVANRPLSSDEIVAYLQRHWGGTGTSLDSAKAMAHAALNAPSGRFVQSKGDLWVYKSEAYDSWQQNIRDQAYTFLQIKKSPCTERELVNYISVNGHVKNSVTRELRTLSTDMRFIVMDGKYLLSRWELLNDKIYNYMTEREITTAKPSEIEEVVRAHYSIHDYSNVVFAPTVDRRFVPQSDGKISLVNAKKQIDNVNEARVTYVVDIIQGKMTAVLGYIGENSNGVSINNIMKHVFKTTSEQHNYAVWAEILTNLLSKRLDAKCIDGLWYPSNKRDSGGMSVTTVHDKLRSELEKTLEGKMKNQSQVVPKHSGYKIRVTPSNENLVQGELQLLWWHVSVLRFSGLQVRTPILIHGGNGVVYDCWYDPNLRQLIGLKTFYRDSAATTNTAFLVWKTNYKEHIFLEIEGTSKPSRQPQQSKVEPVFKETKSIFDVSDVFELICRILVSDAGRNGIVFGEIWALVRTNLPSVQELEVIAILDNNTCFYNTDDKWFLVPSKIGRYYINHRRKEVESQAYFWFRDKEFEDQPPQVDDTSHSSEKDRIESVKRSLIERGKMRGAISYEEVDEALKQIEFEASFSSLNAVYDEIAASGIDLINEAGLFDAPHFPTAIGTKTGETTRVVHIVTQEETNGPTEHKEAVETVSNLSEQDLDFYVLDGIVNDLQVMREKFIEERARIEQVFSSYEEKLTAVIKRVEMLRRVEHE